jgi:HK97 family phage major capsid protein
MAGLVEMRSRLQALRDDATNQRQQLVQRIELERGEDTKLTSAEHAEFSQLSQMITDFDSRIGDLDGEIRRSGAQDEETMALRAATSKIGVEGQQHSAGGPDFASRAQAWGRNAAEALRSNLGGPERRAVISGSVDVPSVVLPQVVSIPYPQRVIDLLVNRVASTYSYVYYRQTARTNNAAPVADLAAKPTSVFTVEEIQDRTRVVAHLSQPLPYRIFTDDEFGPAEIVSWLADQMAVGVTEAIEYQAISGNGSGENMTGILNVAGTTAVPFATDLPTTLRSAITALQNLGEHPNGWVLNPNDAQAIDLLRWSTAGGFLSGGYQNDTRNGFGTSLNVFGDNNMQRVVSPSVPEGTAICGDFNQIRLFLKSSMLLLANAFGDAEFSTNSVILRGEQLVGVGVLRPQAFGVVTLTS